jgi:twitching motility protein PilJ
VLTWAIGLSCIPIFTLGGTLYFSHQAWLRQLSQDPLPSGTTLTAALDRQQRLLFMVVGGAAALTGAITALGAHRILSPIHTAARTAAYLVNCLDPEALEPQIQIGGKDELTSLSTHLNMLVQHLPHRLMREDEDLDPFIVLRPVAQTLQVAQSQTEVLQIAVTQARSLLLVDRAVIYRFDADGEGTFIEASTAPGWPQLTWSTLRDPRFDPEAVAQSPGELVHAIDNIYNAGFSDPQLRWLEGLGIRSELIAPLFQGNTLFGLLIAHQCSGARTWHQCEINLFTQLATQTSFALDKAQLIAQREAAVERLHQLGTLSQRIFSGYNTPEILNTAVTALRQILDLDRVLVYQLDPDWNGTVVAEAVLPSFPKTLRSKIPAPGLADGLPDPSLTSAVVVIPNVETAGLSQEHQAQLQRFAVSAGLIAPILIQEHQLYGLLMAHHCSGPREWQQSEIDLLAQIAVQVARALNQVQRLTQLDQECQTAQAAVQSQGQQLTKLKDQIKIVLQDSSSAQALSKEAFNGTRLVDTLFDQINGITRSAQGLLTDLKQGSRQVHAYAPILEQGQQAVNAVHTSFVASLDVMVSALSKLQALNPPLQQLEGALTRITDLSTQLKLQAMNATLEASRVGEAGHPFAAIAEKVHDLTRQLETELLDFLPLITVIQTETQGTISKLIWGQQQTAKGKSWEAETQQSLQQMVAYHRQMDTLLERVAQAVARQTQDAIATSQTIVQLAHLTSQLSEQSAQMTNTFEQLQQAYPVD